MISEYGYGPWDAPARIPFEDRVDRSVRMSDLDRDLMQDFLTEEKSSMLVVSPHLSTVEIAENLHILANSPVGRLPAYLGLMLFNRHPEDFMPCSWIEINVSTSPEEHVVQRIIRGPVHKQIREALDFIELECIRKLYDDGDPRDRYNYPFTAVKEALINAVLHRGYDSGVPVRVDLLEDRMEITSSPGPDAAITDKDLLEGHLIAPRLRNEGLKRFLKSLGLAEGFSTGTLLIRDTMETNGSDAPRYETDPGRTYMKTVLLIHPGFLPENDTP